MKHLKKYEDTNSELPEVGDYVYIEAAYSNDDLFVMLGDFLRSSYGVIKKIYQANYTEHYYVDVEYTNIPRNLLSYFDRDHRRDFRVDRITAYGKTPEEIEMKLNVNKYNL